MSVCLYEVLVMCDFMATGVWDMHMRVPLSLENDLKIDPNLADNFDKWQATFDTQNDTLDRIQHDSIGLDLALQLKQALPPGSKVWFYETHTNRTYLVD